MLADLALLGGAAALPGCATILHPERQGNDVGPIDVGALILDILWFIPGIVPGIVALVVDFGTGAIYVCRRCPNRTCDHDERRLAILPGERLTVRAPALPRAAGELDVALRLHDSRQAVLHEARGRWSPTRRDDLTVALASDHALTGGGRLELRVHGRGLPTTAEHPLRLGVA